MSPWPVKGVTGTGEVEDLVTDLSSFSIKYFESIKLLLLNNFLEFMRHLSKDPKRTFQILLWYLNMTIHSFSWSYVGNFPICTEKHLDTNRWVYSRVRDPSPSGPKFSVQKVNNRHTSSFKELRRFGQRNTNITDQEFQWTSWQKGTINMSSVGVERSISKLTGRVSPEGSEYNLWRLLGGDRGLWRIGEEYERKRGIVNGDKLCDI